MARSRCEASLTAFRGATAAPYRTAGKQLTLDFPRLSRLQHWSLWLRVGIQPICWEMHFLPVRDVPPVLICAVPASLDAPQPRYSI